MSYPNSMAALMMVVVVALVVASRTAEGQATCASNLVGCADYLNSTTRPPNTCCDPLRQTVTNDLACLCNLYQTPGFLESLGVNLAQALNLSRNCGITSDLSACSAPPPASPNVPPPGTPGNDVSRIQSTGLFSLALTAAYMMLY